MKSSIFPDWIAALAKGRPLADEVAIVTGASRGIGRSVAETLAQAGAVVALAARSAPELERMQQALSEGGGRVLAIPTDLERDSDITALAEITANDLGMPTILVNNAGIGLYGPLGQFPIRHWDRVMAVNARAPFILCRAVLPYMREVGRGTIINLASVVGIKGYVNQGAYSAAKHALMGMSKVLAQEVQADGIRVHTLCPGGVDTEMAWLSRPDLKREELIQPMEIAGLILFLLRTRDGRAVIDDLHIRRASGSPWF
ncbi:MAG TPA: SDR family oxidoreductase [Candidatus Sumerlaeota bacterium]|nr:SDR family oxidoreductase [Candidatus Sumerlaeota bacterium]